MSFADYSLTPASNVTIGGISAAEGCPAGNINNIVRQLAADGKELSNTLTALDVSGKMPKSGGAFTGAITQTGAGSYRHNASSSLTSGATYFLATGSPRPTAAEGVVVFYY